MNIRSLENRDLYTVIGMLKKVGDIGGGKLNELFTSASGDSKKKNASDVDAMSVRLGFLVLGELYSNLVDDLQAWLASLYSISLEEYLKLPPETTIDAIEQLAEGDETKRFFSRAWQLYKKMSQYKIPSIAKSK